MARESDPTAMLGLVILVIVAELLAIAVGVTFGLFIGELSAPDYLAAWSAEDRLGQRGDHLAGGLRSAETSAPRLAETARPRRTVPRAAPTARSSTEARWELRESRRFSGRQAGV